MCIIYFCVCIISIYQSKHNHNIQQIYIYIYIHILKITEYIDNNSVLNIFYI